MLKDFGETEAATRIVKAVETVLTAGVRTADLGGAATTAEFTAAVVAALMGERPA